MKSMLGPLVGTVLVAGCAGVGRVVPLLHGWHYDDLMRDSDGLVTHPPSAIVVWSSEWSSTPEEFGLNRGVGLPSRSHLFLGEYDIARRSSVWWNSTGDEAQLWLEERFAVRRAPSVVFLANPRGRPEFRDATFETWDGGAESWRAWLWSKLAFDLRVANNLAAAVTVRIYAGEHDAGPEYEQVLLLEAHASTSVRVLPSYLAEARDTRGKIVWRGEPLAREDEASCGALNVGVPSASQGRVSAKDLRLRDTLLNSRDQDTTFTHAAVLRQPPVMPSHEGVAAHFLVDMPHELAQRMREYYHASMNKRRPEDYPPESTGMNQHVVNTSMVSFDLDFDAKASIATKLIQPLVEQWAGMPLFFTSFYGIREYYRGAELRMHVDRVATHVFSVIINVDQEGVESDWPLDIIDFHGEKSSVIMQPGQMLFYQSAKLVHGRPQPFNGSRFANCFCHFKPQVGWDYVYGDGDILSFNGKPVIDYKVD